jgi:lysyl-tRNA synthetase class 2
MSDHDETAESAADIAEQHAVRLAKRERMLEAGIAPYPVGVAITTTISEVRASFPGAWFT